MKGNVYKILTAAGKNIYFDEREGAKAQVVMER